MNQMKMPTEDDLGLRSPKF